MTIYTRGGDDGTTGLYFGGRTPKDSPVINATGDLDEAQAFIGLARAATDDPAHQKILVGLEHDLWILMAEVNGSQNSSEKLVDGKSRATTEMVDSVEDTIETIVTGHEMPTEFVVPGENEYSARLDVARTVVRRAERSCVDLLPKDAPALAYLNRASTLLWALARIAEGKSRPVRDDIGL